MAINFALTLLHIHINLVWKYARSTPIYKWKISQYSSDINDFWILQDRDQMLPIGEALVTLGINWAGVKKVIRV